MLPWSGRGQGKSGHLHQRDRGTREGGREGGGRREGGMVGGKGRVVEIISIREREIHGSEGGRREGGRKEREGKGESNGGRVRMVTSISEIKVRRSGRVCKKLNKT